MQPCPPLIACFTALPDPWAARGKRHPLGALMALAVAATLCGSRSYMVMVEWGRTYGAEISQALGFTREKTPCAGTLFGLCRRLDREALEGCLGRWRRSRRGRQARPDG